MHIEKLKSIQECLASAAEAQIYDLENVDAQELGEVIDIIKDIEETIYYCTVTKAMGEGSSAWNHAEEKEYYGGHMTSYNDDQIHSNRNYYGGNQKNTPMMHSTPNITEEHKGTYTEREFPDAFKDGREGKSYRSRRMYMEAKETRQDKSVQMKELEKYVQELTDDIVDMLKNTSQDERQYLSKKIAGLSNKILQLND